jgi:glycosyltransferase involved in cell wall biosynthesis
MSPRVLAAEPGMGRMNDASARTIGVTTPSDRDRRQLLSIVMPARNEQQNLPRAYEELTAVLGRLDCDYEVIVIDNDSSDDTPQVAEWLCARDLRWRYLRFSRNFQVEGSIAAGLRFARGDAALILFSDLQDPPELIPEFVNQWRAGCDVVYGVVRRRAGDPWWKALGARLLYRTVHWMADVHIPPNATDFRLLSRRAIDALNQFDERNRYVRGFSHWIGFRQCPIVYDRRPRTRGQSKAPLWLLATLSANAITSFSIRPLQLFSIAGGFALLGTLALAGLYLAMYLFGQTISGLTTVYLLLLANLALTLLGIGVLGEYVGRIYIETKRRPFYLVDRTINLDGVDAASDPLAVDQRRR